MKFPPFDGLAVMVCENVPPNTILVSPDLWNAMKRQSDRNKEYLELEASAAVWLMAMLRVSFGIL